MNQKSVDFSSPTKDSTGLPLPPIPENNFIKSPKRDLLITIAETDQDKGTVLSEFDRRSRNSNNTGKREDKGKDFFSSITNRNGVLGIVPSVVRRLGLPFKKKNGYAAQEDYDNEDGQNKPNYANQSCELSNRGSNSFTDSKGGDRHHPASVTLRRMGRGQLDGKGIKALEEKLRNLEARGMTIEERTYRDRMIQSMYIKPNNAGTVNLSMVFDHADHADHIDQGLSADSSMVDDGFKPKSGDTSMTQQCLICFDKAPDAVFMECGHGGKGVCLNRFIRLYRCLL